MKKMTIITSYSQDLSLVLQWLRLKRAIKRHGEIRKLGLVYAAEVLSKNSKKEMKSIVKEKFGTFAKVT